MAKVGSARRWFPPGPYITNTGTSGKLREANWAVRGTGEDNKRGDRGLDNGENRKGIKRVSEIQTGVRVESIQADPAGSVEVWAESALVKAEDLHGVKKETRTLVTGLSIQHLLMFDETIYI